MHGGQRAVVTEVGAGLRSYGVAGRAVVDGYPAGSISTSGRGQVLMPWPNRLEDGSYELDGRHHQLPLTEPERQNAIHGLVRWVPWRIAHRTESAVALEHVLHPQPGYPFTLALAVEYALSGEGLSVRTTATNEGDSTCLFGCGAHPYLSVGTPTVDTVVLSVPAQTVLRSNERGLPVDRGAVQGTELDFRSPRLVGSTVLDHAFTDLLRDDDGLARVELRDPASAQTVTLWLDGEYTYVMVFSGDTLPDVDRRSLAVEPMTCPPNAFRSGDARRLEPGVSVTAAWGITTGPSSDTGDDLAPGSRDDHHA